MKRSRTSKVQRRRFSSRSISLLLGGALATTSTMFLTGCAPDEPAPPLPTPTTKVISNEQLKQDLRENKNEENNSYVPGLGYYHSVHRSWYPYPFDYYYPGLGYYRGGGWNGTSYPGLVPARTTPNWKTVTDDQPGSVSHGGGGYHAYVGTGAAAGESVGGVSRGGFTAPHSQGFHAGFGGAHGSGS